MAERMKAGDYASALMGDAMTTLQQARQMARSGSSRRGAQDYARRSVASSNEAIRSTLLQTRGRAAGCGDPAETGRDWPAENRAREAEDRAREVQEEADRQVASLESQKSAAEEQVSSAAHSVEPAEKPAEALSRSVSDLESESARLRAEKERPGPGKSPGEVDKQKTEGRLQAALSQVADTRDSARGLILNLPDILFDVNKATLKTELKTAIAKLAGILFIMPELQVRIEGHTDSTGSEEYTSSSPRRGLRACSVFCGRRY